MNGIIALEELLPVGWDYNVGQRGKELDLSIAEECKNRGIDKDSPEMDKIGTALLEKHYDLCICRTNTTRKLLGLDFESIESMRRKINEFNGSCGWEMQPIEKYARILSSIIRIFDGDLTGRKIIEIGPSKDGLKMLDFLGTYGAQTIVG